MPMRRAVRMTRQAISPRLAIRILRNIAASHPEDAEAGRLDGRVQRGGYTERQHHPRLGGIDHAVVPEPRARVIGMTLRLVLRLDRSLERGFLGLGPFSAA